MIQLTSLHAASNMRAMICLEQGGLRSPNVDLVQFDFFKNSNVDILTTSSVIFLTPFSAPTTTTTSSTTSTTTMQMGGWGGSD